MDWIARNGMTGVLLRHRPDWFRRAEHDKTSGRVLDPRGFESEAARLVVLRTTEPVGERGASAAAD